jgi:pimeloyl-ACP methyl ester carboxylesterase
LRPGLTIEDFANDIANLIEAEELQQVVLVGHSFAGAPIWVVADRNPEALKHLIYLEAVVLETVKARFSKLEPATVAHRVKLAQETSERLATPSPSPAAFGVTETEAAACRRLTPQPLSSYQELIRLAPPEGSRKYFGSYWSDTTALMDSFLLVELAADSLKKPWRLCMRACRRSNARPSLH